MLKDAVQTHGGKNWVAIVALVPGRTKKTCCNRWQHDIMERNIDSASGRTGTHDGFTAGDTSTESTLPSMALVG
jgi:hypothetical protein